MYYSKIKRFLKYVRPTVRIEIILKYVIREWIGEIKILCDALSENIASHYVRFHTNILHYPPGVRDKWSLFYKECIVTGCLKCLSLQSTEFVWLLWWRTLAYYINVLLSIRNKSTLLNLWIGCGPSSLRGISDWCYDWIVYLLDVG